MLEIDKKSNHYSSTIKLTSGNGVKYTLLNNVVSSADGRISLWVSK